MRLHKKTIQGRLKHLAILLFLVPLLNNSSFANDKSPPVTSQNSARIRHEPVQPIVQTKILNPEKVKLGEALFHDTRLGHNSDMSCSTCHILTENGAKPCRHTPGQNTVEHGLNTPTVFNSSLNHQLFWDGRAMNLQQQIDFVVNSESEFATSWPVIIDKLQQDKAYQKTFNKLYASGISADSIRDAIASFESSLLTLNSRFDQYLLGDTDAINKEEKQGYHLFKTYGCVACHQGSNVGGNLFMKIGVFGDFFAGHQQTKADQGRFNITGDEADRHVFRVPSLRLAVLTSPYFHDGSVKTLTEAVRIMAKHQLGREISEQDIDYIIAFLKTLPGEYKSQTLHNMPQQKQQDASK